MTLGDIYDNCERQFVTLQSDSRRNTICKVIVSDVCSSVFDQILNWIAARALILRSSVDVQKTGCKVFFRFWNLDTFKLRLSQFCISDTCNL